MDLKNLEPLQPLDLEEYNTVGETVRAMRQCSFGARMLGETADSLYTLIAGGTPPLVVYDGKQISPLGTLLRIMQAEGLLDVICTSRDYWQLANRGGVIVVVDRYAEMYEDILYGKPDRAIFINDFGLAKPYARTKCITGTCPAAHTAKMLRGGRWIFPGVSAKYMLMPHSYCRFSSNT